MRKLIVFAMLIIASNLIAANYSTTMTPIISKGEEVVKYIEDELNMEVVRMEFDILRDTKTTKRVLSKGWTYTIVAFGDFRFTDIDVRVYRKRQGDWQLVDKDNDSSAIAVVGITPTYDEEYMIEISAFSFKSGYDVGHYGLIIAHE